MLLSDRIEMFVANWRSCCVGEFRRFFKSKIREGLDVILGFYHLQFRRPRPANNPTFHDKSSKGFNGANQPRIYANKARIKGKRIVCKHPERRNIDSINRKLVNNAHGEIFIPTAGGLRLK